MTAVRATSILLGCFIAGGLIGLVVMTARYNRAFTDASAEVQHTLEVLDETQQALSVVLQDDGAQTPDAVTYHVRLLGRLTADNPLQQQRVDSLLSYIQAFSPDAVPASAQSSHILRSILLRMQGEENRLLALREAANSKSRKLLRNAILGLLTGIFALLSIASFLIAYNFNRRRKAEKGLAESEHQFRLFMQYVKDYAIFMVDPEGRVMNWNKGAERIKGYKAQEIIGKHISIFYTEEEIQRHEPEDNLQKAAEMGSYEIVGLRKKKDGTLFYADVVFTCIHNDNGDITGYVKITKDISDQMKSEEEMKLSLRREKELNEMKSRFVTLASHEFKTPLSVILSSTSLIERYSASDQEDKRMRHIQRIKSNVKNLRQILGDFLSLEKLEEGVVRNNPSATNVVALAEEIILDIQEAGKPGQMIDLKMSGEPQIVALDENLLRNILNNLLSNAVKYSPECTPIRFLIEFHTGTLKFTVSDGGIGIPPEEQKHLFERFFRASNTSGISGTGLGLSIVKRHLELMGGQIDVSSEAGKGTIVMITLPAPVVRDPAMSGRDEVHRHQ